MSRAVCFLAAMWCCVAWGLSDVEDEGSVNSGLTPCGTRGVRANESADHQARTVNAESPCHYRRVVFDGKSLDGWTVEHEAEAEVVDGELLLRAGRGWLRADHLVRDFRLEFSWQALKPKDYDAGVFFRARPAPGQPFPQGYQLNLQANNEGEIIGVPGTRTAGLICPGDWNDFDLLVVGDRARLVINGKLAYDVRGLTGELGFVGFQIEVPDGGQFLLKDIALTEVGFRSLFDGKSFAGWESGTSAPLESCWKIEQGQLVCTGEKGPWLRTLEEHGDFNLRLEYQVSPGGNSGVYVRVPRDGNHHRENDQQPAAGFEVQILDDAHPMYRSLKDFQYCASVYDFVGANPRNSKPAGRWNTLEINCRGGHVTTVHNGAIVTNLSDETVPGFGLRLKRGFLGLQNHSTRVAFRNVRLGPALEYPPP
jgi:hypothetical protein